MIKHRVTIWPSNSTTRYIPKRNGNVCSYKNLYPNVYSRIIYTSQEVETTQNKIWYIHTVEYYSVIKRNATTWMNDENIMLSERRQTQIPHTV